MRSSQFFRYCRELVGLRWIVRFNPFGGIMLFRFVSAVSGDFDEYFSPAVAVANDVKGFMPTGVAEQDQWTACHALGLNFDFADLVITVSDRSVNLGPKAISVREELVFNLTDRNFHQERFLVRLSGF